MFIFIITNRLIIIEKLMKVYVNNNTYYLGRFLISEGCENWWYKGIIKE